MCALKNKGTRAMKITKEASAETRQAENTALVEVVQTRRFQHEELVVTQMGANSIVGTASDAIITIDDDANILSWNAAATHTFGHDEKDASGQKPHLIIPNHYHKVHDKDFACASGAHTTSVLFF
jgi:PAS domain-containing protein